MPAKEIVTANERVRSLLRFADQIARSDTAAVIFGETGTGKELLARYLHTHSARCAGPFVAVNCTALPETLWEAELFGYERGAFTGALDGKPGKFELAHTGTLLLDEVSEMPLSLQAKLLRVLQEREVDRLGSRRPTPINVRVIAATNRDLRSLVRSGLFREDLYYRLAVVTLSLLPLRERREDIPLIVSAFFADKGLPRTTLTEDALFCLHDHDWPGNVRELLNVLERALLYAQGCSSISAEHIHFDTFQAGIEPSAWTPHTMQEIEYAAIMQTLRMVNNHRTRAAQILDISPRTLRHKIRAGKNPQ